MNLLKFIFSGYNSTENWAIFFIGIGTAGLAFWILSKVIRFLTHLVDWFGIHWKGSLILGFLGLIIIGLAMI